MADDKSNLTQVAALQVKSTLSKNKNKEEDIKEFKERHQDLEWQDSSNAKMCSKCTKKFTMFTPKHHCRTCGNVLCGQCSSYKMVINGILKRACIDCYKTALSGDANTSGDMTFYISSNGRYTSRGMSIDSNDEDTSSSITPGENSINISNPSVLNSSEKAGIEMPPWAEAIVYIRRKELSSEVLQTPVVFPDRALPEALIADIACNSIANAMQGTTPREINFMFRVRDKSSTLTSPDSTVSSISTSTTVSSTFYVCFVSYRQWSLPSDPNGKPVLKQAVVLVSKWPFHQIAYRMLSMLDETMFHQQGMAVTTGSAGTDRASVDNFAKNEMTVEMIENALMVAFGNIMCWPPGKPGHSMYMPYLGEMFEYYVPPDISSTINNAKVSLSSSFWMVNLVTLLGPLGLLQHLYVLWELVASGNDIIVYASSPAQCSEVVIALASLLAPLNCLGDIRPYISKGDSDVAYINAQVQYKQQQGATAYYASSSREIRQSCKIVGTDDISVIDQLDAFTALLMLSPRAVKEGYNKGDTVFIGMRERNAASIHVITSTVGSSTVVGVSADQGEAGQSNPTINPKRSHHHDSLAAHYHNWVAKGRNGSALVTKAEPAGLTEKKMLKKIKAMEPGERAALGNALIRDNLRLLTQAFFSKMDEINEKEAKPLEVESAQDKLDKEAADKAAAELLSASSAGKARALTPAQKLSILMGVLYQWVLENVPTVIMWCLMLTGLLVYWALGLPVEVLSVVIFFVSFTDKPSKEFENLLQSIISPEILYPNESKEAVDDTDIRSSDSSQGALRKRADLSGVWKRTKCINYENFVGAQGAGYVQRKLAASINMVHTITMDSGVTAFRLQEKGGPIDSDNLFAVGGDEINTLLIKKEFQDKVYWDETNALTIRKLSMPDKDYQLIVKRTLESNGQTIKLVANYENFKDPSKNVETVCYFEKQGPSPNAPPTPFDTVESSPAAAPAVSSAPQSLDFSGTWVRKRTHNFDAFVGVQGAGFMQRKLAASIPLTHTITMSALTEGETAVAVRLQERGGPLDLDNTYTLGNDFQDSVIIKKKFRDKMNWSDSIVSSSTVGTGLVLQRVVEGGEFELVMTRTIESEGNLMVLKSIHRNLETLVETEATSWFERTGPSDSAVPVPRPDSTNTVSSTVRSDSVSSTAYSGTVSTTSVSSDTVSSDTVSRSVSSTSVSSTQEHVMSEGDSTNISTRKVQFGNPNPSEDEEEDNEEDDDNVALEKMRSRSVSRSSPTTTVHVQPSVLYSSVSKPVGAIIKPILKKASTNSTSNSKRLQLAGTWERSNSAVDVDSLVNAGDENAPQGRLLKAMKVSQVITFNDPLNTHVRIEESLGGIKSDLTYPVDGVQPTVTETLRKTYSDRVHFEGDALVVHRVHSLNDFEIIIKRYLEDNGTSLRQVTCHRNLITGEESESMSLFKKIGPSKSKIVITPGIQ